MRRRMAKKKKHDADADADDDDDDDDDDNDDMALDGNEDHDDQARSKAMLETAFRSDAFERVPKRVPNRLEPPCSNNSGKEYSFKWSRKSHGVQTSGVRVQPGGQDSSQSNQTTRESVAIGAWIG